MKWFDMDSAPKDGTRVIVFIPYSPELFDEGDCTDVGWWSADDQCWRFEGDDGPDDMQPTKWRPE